jgi:hypothetical protein
MVRLISESEVPRGLHYNRQTGVYKPNLQGLAVLMFEDVWDRSIFCDRILLSGGAPDTEDFVKVDNGGFYNTSSFPTIVDCGVPTTNFCKDR